MNCLECHNTKWIKTDRKRKNEDEVLVTVWKCGRCGHLQNGYAPFVRQKPKELYFDIETSFNVVGIFDLKVKSGYIPPECILKPSFVICWGASWIGQKEVFSGVVTPTQAKKGDDSKILLPLWNLLNQADIVIGHNSNSFDIKKMNYRFLLNGMNPPESYKTIDTLKVARKNFAAESNKMDYLSTRLNGLSKHKMEYQDWVDCAAGIPEALDKMARYNINDVKEGKTVYEKMLSWIPVHTGQIVRPEAVR